MLVHSPQLLSWHESWLIEGFASSAYIRKPDGICIQISHISSHNINGKRFCAVAKKKDWKLSFWLPLKWHQISHFYSFLCFNIIVFVMLLNDIFFFSGKPISWALLNPSVSPFKVSANGMVVESSNPAVRLYRYNTFTGEVCLFLYTI